MSQVPRAYRRPIATYGPLVNQLARRLYGISGQQLLGRLTKGESGFRMGAVSPANARGGTQFTPGSRQIAISRFGIDPWKNPDQAEHAAALHLLGKINGSKGLSGYNPGSASYADYILGQRVSGLGGRGGRGGGGGISSFAVSPVKTTTQQTVSTPSVPQSGGLPMPAFSAANKVALPQGFGQIPSGGGPAPPSTVTTTTSTSGGGVTGAQGAPGGTGAPGRSRGQYVVAPGANRPGVGLSGDLTRFVSLTAGRYGRTLRIGTGTAHNRLTTTGNVSDHWDGHAADIPVPYLSAKGDRIATAALIEAGVPVSRARQMARQGGLYTLTPTHGPLKGHRIQVIWRVTGAQNGGDHTTHVHLGIQ